MKLDFKIFKPKKKKFRKGGIHINPDIYWGILLGIVFVATISLMIFGYFLFKKTSKNTSSAPNETNQVEKIDRAKIDSALLFFSERAEKSKEILNSPSPIVDPSR
jgi:hypothetical protein